MAWFAGNICSAKTFRVRAIGSLFILQLLYYYFKYRQLVVFKFPHPPVQTHLTTSTAVHSLLDVVPDDMTIINATELNMVGPKM